jgi:DNA polymerase IV
MERQIIHLRVARFPIAVERVVHPELRGRPVLIAQPGSHRSVVTETSSEAWNSGIRAGMPLARATKICRNAIVLPPNEELYLRASRAIHRVLEGFSPMLEPSGHGHAYLDVSGTVRLFGPARDTAWKAQKEIRRLVHLDASIGVASNKLVSRIAAEISKPLGLQDVPHGDEPSFLSPLPVRLLPGVGLQIEKQLDELNIRVMRELATMKLEHLTLAFGRFGFVLHHRALGVDSTPVYPVREIPAVDCQETLAEDSNDDDLLRTLLSQLCSEAGEELRERQQSAGGIGLRVMYADRRDNWRKLKFRAPVRSSMALFAYALRLLPLVLDRRTRVRSMHVRLTDLSTGAVQMELFSNPGAERRSKLECAVDALRRRFGKETIGILRSAGSA